MDRQQRESTDGRSTPQGEAVTVWGLWGVLLVAMAVTYSRLPLSELYHVSHSGPMGGLSRVLAELNFPIALVAIALVIVAAGALPARAWWVGAPAIVLCVVTVWPGVIDEGDLDVRVVNVVPAIGVALALGLTIAAARSAGGRSAERRPFDPVRFMITVGVFLLSLPWIAADLGVFAPEGPWIMERPIAGSDGALSAAVHLGHHHGLDGALLVVTAVVLSRVRLDSPRLRRALTGYLSLMFGYGLLNFVEDGWYEQVVKRGWADWRIPSALVPSLTPIWLVIVVVAVMVGLLLRREPGGGASPVA